ncbi:MAG: alpha/beta hydrolase [Rhodothermales bacterium]|nr:alpha/beta hydrolase [Rhodothermales bacterium]
MRTTFRYLLVSLAICITTQGCFAVFYGGMPIVYDSVHLEEGQEIKDLPYDTFGIENPKGRLNLYLPATGDSWPVVIFVHGGGWSSGDKDLKIGGKKVYLNIGRFFAANGIASAVINYRLIPGVHWQTQIGDIARATRWVHENIESYGGDPDALFLAGHSAGAHLISHVALNDELLTAFNMTTGDIRGVIAVSGAAYRVEDDVTNQNGEMMSYLEKRFTVVDNSGRWVQDASVLQFVDADDPPFQIFVGGAEIPGLIRQSTLLKETLDSAGVPNTFELISGRKHARMILLMSGNGNGVGEKMIQFVQDYATDLDEQK